MTHEEFKKRYKYDSSKDLLGKGGFGKVFKAYDTIQDLYVAIKIAEVTPGSESTRLKKEVERIKKRPLHTNIACYQECYTFEESSGTYDFAILQYYELGNLLQLVEGRTLSFDEIQHILRGILKGIDFLHENEITHRDLKPENILMVKRKDGKNEYIPKITDFGISREWKGSKSDFLASTQIGTISYSSPEQLKGKTMHRNTDLWSFGIIAFRLFTGKLPFKEKTESQDGLSELMKQIKLGILPGTINTVPEPWQTLIRKCLIPDPEKRVKDCAECERILSNNSEKEAHEQDKIAGIGIKEKETINIEEYIKEGGEKEIIDRKRRKKIITGILALALFALFVGICFYFFPRIRPDDKIDSATSETTRSKLIAEADSLCKLEKWVEALPVYEKALEIDGNDTVIRSKIQNLEKIKSENFKKDRDDALASYEMATKHGGFYYENTINKCNQALDYKEDKELERIKKEMEDKINGKLR